MRNDIFGKRTLKEWVIWYLRQPFVLVVWFIETFKKNRERLKAFTDKHGIAKILKAVAVGTFFVWLLVFAFLSTQEDGDRFTCALKSLWPDADRTGCTQELWEKPAADQPPAN